MEIIEVSDTFSLVFYHYFLTSDTLETIDNRLWRRDRGIHKSYPPTRNDIETGTLNQGV